MRTLAPLALTAVLAGCRSPAPPAAGPSSGPSATTRPVADIRAACAEELRRELACEDDFVAMIVDTRIRLDVPPGTAARAAEPNGRARLLEEATAEFSRDYAPDKIERVCQRRQAALESSPEAMPQIGSIGAACTAQPDCAAFTACMAPILDKLLRLGVSGT
jgi:hypothetical protein